MTQVNPCAIQKIAIIGAGPSGLATAKYLLAENSFSRIVIYEQRDTVGGTWNYTPLQNKSKKSTNNNSNGHPTSSATSVVTADLEDFNTPMYDGLESNLPHMLMQYSDTPFPVTTQLFPSRETVLGYLENYASEIRSLISFHHKVISVTPIGGDEYHGWDVKVQETTGARESKVEGFDAVIVANGRCGWPMLPDIEGLDTWAGLYPESLFHSISYKNPRAFKDKRVLLVGGGPSAADLIHQIGSVSKHPLLVAQNEKSPYHTDEPYISEHPALAELLPHKRAARFADGSMERDIEAIILCTGYAHRYPFLAPIAPKIEDEGIRALPMYRHIFHIHHPTLAFVEIPEKIVPFPLVESQAAVIARVFSGRLSLPSLPDRSLWQNAVPAATKTGGKPHVLGPPPQDLVYMNELYQWSKQAPPREDGEEGKLPKYWEAMGFSWRMAAPQMKIAFNRRGEERRAVQGYEELGFGFWHGSKDEWCC